MIVEAGVGMPLSQILRVPSPLAERKREAEEGSQQTEWMQYWGGGAGVVWGLLVGGGVVGENGNGKGKLK